jgi:hypothetical protein
VHDWLWHSWKRLHVSPSGRVGTHAPPVAQYVPLPHSLSRVQPLDASGAPASGVPASGAGPQSLSLVSHTPDTQTRFPTAGVQTETLDGVVGSGSPLAIFGAQRPLVPEVMSHQSPFEHSASVVHAVVHIPFVVSHVGASLGQVAEVRHSTQAPVVVSQMGVDPEHSLLSLHATQSPATAPLVPHVIERQSFVPSVAVHGPSPLA